MQASVCTECGFVALCDEDKTTCPVCGATSFEVQDSAVFKAGDKTDFAEGEKKHIPAITVVDKCGLIEGCTDIHVAVGEVTHPMTAEHSIQNVDFYIDDKYVARAQFQHEKINPAAALHLKEKKGKLTVIERCNLHGAWINEVSL